MDIKTLEALGLTKEDIAERLIARAVEALLYDSVLDADGDPVQIKSQAARKLTDAIQKRLEEATENGE